MPRILHVSLVVSLLVCVLMPKEALAVGAREEATVPPALRPWIPWVLSSPEGKEAICPIPHGDSSPQCEWPSRLSLSLRGKGGAFTQQVRLFREGAVSLPGDSERWPSRVAVDGKPSPVADGKVGPVVYLAPGDHTITGAFFWDTLPEDLRIPAESGLVALSIDGRAVPIPDRDSEGRLFLRPGTPEKAEPDRVDIEVFRKLTYGAPLLLETWMNLKISGKGREVRLGRALPDGFEATRFETYMPLRLDGSGHAVVQGKTGSYTVVIYARRNASVLSVVRPDPDGPWVEGHEAWVFEEQPDFRRVSVTGVPAIDPAQTRMPDSWRRFPAYAMAPGATMSFTSGQGITPVPPDMARLQRTLWLDMEGGGYSVSDEIVGVFHRATRLDGDGSLRLGRVVMDGKDAFITRFGVDGNAGVELRKWKPSLRVESRVEGQGGTLPANGYARAFDKVSAVLHLPPGYRLFHATGMDEVRGTWIKAWSVLDLCLMVLCVVGTAKLFGARAGGMAVVALGLVFLERDAPRLAWLLVLAGEVVRRLARDGKFAVVGTWVRPATFLVLGGALFTFIVDHVVWLAGPVVVNAAGSSVVPTWSKQDIIPDRFVNFMARPPEDAPTPAESADTKNSRINTLSGMAGNQHAYGLMGIGAGSGEGGIGLGNFGTMGGSGGGGNGEGYGRRHKGKEKRHAQERLYPLKGPKDAPPMPVVPVIRRAPVDYDPSMQVQTGYGLPTWSATAAGIDFHSRVEAGKTLRLYVLPPWATQGLTMAQVLALLLFARTLWRRSGHSSGTSGVPVAKVAAVATVACLLVVWPSPAGAQALPDDGTLASLREHLYPTPACRPHCASLEELILEVDVSQVRMRIVGSAVASTAIALPTDLKTWIPTQVALNGSPARALRVDGGELWVSIPAGLFTVELRGPTLRRESLQLPMRMAPHRVKATASGYAVDGVHEDGAVDDSVQLTLQADARPDTSAATPTLPAFLQVSRAITLGLKWQAHTVVTRQGDLGAPVIAEIPLLPGESVATPLIRVDTRKQVVNLNLSPTEPSVEWDSTLAEAPSLRLWFDPATAPNLFERWSVEVGGIWHASFDGIPPLVPNAATVDRLHVFHPFPGESVRITVTKPMGAVAPTLTIDESTLWLTLNDRVLSGHLTFAARTSRGTAHTIVLPAGATVEAVRRDGEAFPINFDGRALHLNFTPGRQVFEVDFRTDQGLSTFFRPPTVDLGIPSANHRTEWRFDGTRRFHVWLQGPSNGPRVHTAFILAFLIVVAIGLRRVPLAIGFFDWVMALVCLSLVGWGAAVGLVALLVFLGWRNTRTLPAALYNLSQVVVGAGTAIAACVWILFFADRSFMLPPSTLPMFRPLGDSLMWFQDRVPGALPRPWMLSLPVWTYHVALVVLGAWFLWRLPRLALVVWQAFKRDGLWKVETEPVDLT